MPVRVEKTSGETVVIGFKPENLMFFAGGLVRDGGDGRARDSGGGGEAPAPGPRPSAHVAQAQTPSDGPAAEGAQELKCFSDDAHRAFATSMFSPKEKDGERPADAREIVVRMAETLDKHQGQGGVAVQQADGQAGVLLRPMFPAAEAPGSKGGCDDLIMLCIYRPATRADPELERTLGTMTARGVKPDICEYPTAEVQRLVRVLDANADKFEFSMRDSAEWREWCVCTCVCTNTHTHTHTHTQCQCETRRSGENVSWLGVDKA